MFGYVIVNKDELKVKEYEEYRRYYCGLCHALGDRYGSMARIGVSYDLTFLAMLLTGLYEPEESMEKAHCIAHPVKAVAYVTNAAVEYAADMNVFLMYYKCKDDFKDENARWKDVYRRYLGSKSRMLRENYPSKCAAVRKALARLSDAEKRGDATLDELCGYFGAVLREVFCYREDEWGKELGDIGYALGKFLYLMDAYDDRKRDCETKNFNPLLHLQDGEEYIREYVRDVLRIYAAEATAAFERLPIIKHAGILRNVLYSGIWSVFYGRCEKNLKEHKSRNETVGRRGYEGPI